MDRYRDRSLRVEERAKDLLGRMTLREKAGQLDQRMFGWKAYEKTENGYRVSEAFREEVAAGDGLGALYGLFRADPWSQVTVETGIPPEDCAAVSNLLQQYVLENTRLGIPLLLSEECPHGHMALDGTMFPTNPGIGSSWNCELYEEAYRQVAAEIRSTGANLGLVSALDILQDPRWGRSEECYGEDPYLSAAMAAAATRGLQGTEAAELRREDRVGAVLKHFCAQGAAVGGHNGKAAVLGERELREIHLPAMKAAAEAGAVGCMAAYNEIDGIYCHANPTLLTGILRQEWGFDGIVMSDGCAVDNLTRVAGSGEAAVTLAIRAGVDLNLWSNSYKELVRAVESGRLPEELLDRAVYRVLLLKFRLGLFEQPYTRKELAAEVRGNRHAREINRKLAVESVVLLKNENNVLPLGTGLKKITVIGPNADSLYNQLGDYTPPQREGIGSTLLQGIRRVLGAGTEVLHARGCGIRETSREGFGEALEAARAAEVVVLALGGSSARDFDARFDKNGAALPGESRYEMDCGEGLDVAGLEPGGVQLELAERIAALGKPVIAVLIQGRPYALGRIAEQCSAVLCAWYPGQEGGEAIADILFGRECPSGRLPVSIPRSSAQLPVYYNYKETSDYLDLPAAPLYPFGFGLSYTAFVLGELQLSTDRVSAAQLNGNGEIRVAVRITNTGPVKGAEVVQLYISAAACGISRRVKELKGFRKIVLEPGESAVAAFCLGKEELGIWDYNMQFTVVPGKVTVITGTGNGQTLEKTLDIEQ